MGGSTSSEAYDYQAALFSDTKMVSKVRTGQPEEKNASPPRVDTILPGNELRDRPLFGEGKILTLHDSFLLGASGFPDNNMLGTRCFPTEPGDHKRGAYVWLNYKQVQNMSRKFGAGLVALGHGANDNVGIFAENRAEWVISQLGIFAQSMRVVSLYATLGDKAVEYIANHAELQTIIVSKENLVHLMKSLSEVTHTNSNGFLKHIIQFDEMKGSGINNSHEALRPEDIKTCEEHGIKLLSFSDVVASAPDDAPNNPPSPDNWAFIMYTSGTTGVPKGAILTHGNLVATLGSTDARFSLGPTDRHISYLPLAHIFETVVEQAMFANGGSVGFFQGNIKFLTLDQIALRPTIWCGVPRVFDKVYKTIMAGVEEGGCAKGMIFDRAFSVSTELCRTSSTARDEFYDDRVWIPVRKDKLGLDQVRYIITGAAPCPPYLMEFLRVVVGCPVIQGYGMTETSAAATIMSTQDITTGHNGAPLPCNEIKLVDVEEMNYLHTDEPHPRGEIWVRGANIFKGYYKNEKATNEDIQDGWLKTGDIGRWNPNGTLSIIDRKKNIFKLSQGEYIAAEKCEAVYAKSSITAQMFIYGNSYKSFVVAIVVPQAVPLHVYFKNQGWWGDVPDMDIKQYATTPEFIEKIHTIAQAHAEETNSFVMSCLRTEEGALKKFERPQAIFVETRLDSMLQGFTEANECLTPTFKLRRPFLLKRYLNELMAMYEKNGEPNRADEHWPGV
jgi:long-chain acyl-CoA synthetase